MRRRRVHDVVGAVNTSASQRSISIRPEDEPDARADFWIGGLDEEWTVVE